MATTSHRFGVQLVGSRPEVSLIRPARPIGRPKKVAPKVAVNIRLDPEVLAYFRATGRGWQSRINEALRKVVGL